MKEQKNILNKVVSQDILQKKNNDARSFAKKVDWTKFKELQKKGVQS